jgi:hypothetical protein
VALYNLYLDDILVLRRIERHRYFRSDLFLEQLNISLIVTVRYTIINCIRLLAS